MRSVDAMVKKGVSATEHKENDIAGMRKGPWTSDEDTILVNYIATHGEGHWNSLARAAGLRRNGKSCRLRWLNYLRPDVRRGNITLQEQILILELHSQWGNRWSKIAEHLPGRTDNEIKNYWRTRVIKQAKQLNCDVNSKQFRDTLRHVWMPRLLERVQPAPALDPDPSGTEKVKQGQSFSSGSSGAYSDSSSLELHVGSNSDHELLGRDVSDLRPSFSNQMLEQGNGGGGHSLENLWNDESMWFNLQQFSDDLESTYS